MELCNQCFRRSKTEDDPRPVDLMDGEIVTGADVDAAKEATPDGHCPYCGSEL